MCGVKGYAINDKYKLNDKNYGFKSATIESTNN